MNAIIFRRAKKIFYFLTIFAFASPAFSLPVFHNDYRIVINAGFNNQEVAVGQLQRIDSSQLSIVFHQVHSRTVCQEGCFSKDICSFCQVPPWENRYTISVISENGRHSQWKPGVGEVYTTHETVIKGAAINDYENFDYDHHTRLNTGDGHHGHSLYVMFSEAHERFLQTRMQPEDQDSKTDYLALVLPFSGYINSFRTKPLLAYNEYLATSQDPARVMIWMSKPPQ